MEFNWNLPGEIKDSWPTHEAWNREGVGLSEKFGFLRTTFLAGFTVGWCAECICPKGKYMSNKKECMVCPDVSLLLRSQKFVLSLTNSCGNFENRVMFVMAKTEEANYAHLVIIAMLTKELKTRRKLAVINKQKEEERCVCLLF
jgi:hypothetical protein